LEGILLIDEAYQLAGCQESNDIYDVPDQFYLDREGLKKSGTPLLETDLQQRMSEHKEKISKSSKFSRLSDKEKQKMIDKDRHMERDAKESRMREGTQEGGKREQVLIYKPSSGNDFGKESITEIVNFLDKNIGLICVIAAGYEHETYGCFMGANEGMPRRFPNIFNIQRMDFFKLTELLIMSIKAKLGVKFPLFIEFINKTLNTEKIDNIEDIGKVTLLCLYFIYVLDVLDLLKNGPGDLQNLSNYIIQQFNSDLMNKTEFDEMSIMLYILYGFKNFLVGKGFDLKIECCSETTNYIVMIPKSIEQKTKFNYKNIKLQIIPSEIIKELTKASSTSYKTFKEEVISQKLL
jgi:hypothetical protein